MRRSAILASVLALLPALASADDILLKGGGRVTGRIVMRTATSVQVDIGIGSVTVPMSSVVSIEERRTVLDEYEERAAKIRPDDAAGWLQLAKWAASEGLGTQARRLFERVLVLDPQSIDANQALHRVLVDGRWVSEEESYRARGFVRFEGQWMTQAEHDATLAEREARLRELARIDADRRVRDAEQRAAEADARAWAAQAAAPYSTGIPLWYGGWGGGLVVPTYPQGWRGHKRGHWPATTTNPASPYTMSPWPASPLGTWSTFPIGPAGSFPIGPAGSFPIGPSPPPRATQPSGSHQARAARPPGRRR